MRMATSRGSIFEFDCVSLQMQSAKGILIFQCGELTEPISTMKISMVFLHTVKLNILNNVDKQ